MDVALWWHYISIWFSRQVQEWLCLNCQMQRALGMDMTTPQSKQLGGLAKAPSQPDLSRSSTNLSGKQDHTRSAGSSPSKQSQEQPLDKLFGFGASILSQASTLMSVDPLLPPQPPPAPTKTRQGPVSGPASGPAPAPGLHAPPQQQPAQRPKELGKLEPNCPLCKAELNVSKFSEPPNYSTCTRCHTRVCNMCGFNPTPHLVEVRGHARYQGVGGAKSWLMSEVSCRCLPLKNKYECWGNDQKEQSRKGIS